MKRPDLLKKISTLPHVRKKITSPIWKTRPSTSFLRRLGKSSHELGQTSGNASCPDIWELDNGDVAIIGQDLTGDYQARLPEGVSIDLGERLVVIP